MKVNHFGRREWSESARISVPLTWVYALPSTFGCSECFLGVCALGLLRAFVFLFSWGQALQNQLPERCGVWTKISGHSSSWSRGCRWHLHSYQNIFYNILYHFATLWHFWFERIEVHHITKLKSWNLKRSWKCNAWTFTIWEIHRQQVEWRHYWREKGFASCIMFCRSVSPRLNKNPGGVQNKCRSVRALSIRVFAGLGEFWNYDGRLDENSLLNHAEPKMWTRSIVLSYYFETNLMVTVFILHFSLSCLHSSRESIAHDNAHCIFSLHYVVLCKLFVDVLPFWPFGPLYISFFWVVCCLIIISCPSGTKCPVWKEYVTVVAYHICHWPPNSRSFARWERLHEVKTSKKPETKPWRKTNQPWKTSMASVPGSYFIGVGLHGGETCFWGGIPFGDAWLSSCIVIAASFTWRPSFLHIGLEKVCPSSREQTTSNQNHFNQQIPNVLESISQAQASNFEYLSIKDLVKVNIGRISKSELLVKLQGKGRLEQWCFSRFALTTHGVRVKIFQGSKGK